MSPKRFGQAFVSVAMVPYCAGSVEQVGVFAARGADIDVTRPRSPRRHARRREEHLLSDEAADGSEVALPRAVSTDASAILCTLTGVVVLAAALSEA